ncbi:MAG: hypothetical protein P1Q69_00910 [Candidatus Thorarchaeota archaeon]|nr:hypothetical protein [Candidatus Thorarchaeota archaeon]
MFDYYNGIRHPMILNVTDIQDIRFLGLSEDFRLGQAFQKCREESYFEEEIESQVSLKDAGEDAPAVVKQMKVDISMTEHGQTFSYKGLELSGKRIVVSLESNMGDFAELYVVHDVYKYLQDSQYAGGVYTERVDTEVNDNLAPYDLEEEELKAIREKVKRALGEEGIRFIEE